MNKEEVLRKSRQEQRDEFVCDVERKGRAFGMVAVDIVCVIAYVFLLLSESDSYIHFMGNRLPLQSLVMVPGLLGESVYALCRYYYLKDKRSLFKGIVLTIALLAFLYRLFVTGLPQ